METKAKSPELRKGSRSTETLSNVGRNGNDDENHNFNFVQEEIAPGRKKTIRSAVIN